MCLFISTKDKANGTSFHFRAYSNSQKLGNFDKMVMLASPVLSVSSGEKACGERGGGAKSDPKSYCIIHLYTPSCVILSPPAKGLFALSYWKIRGKLSRALGPVVKTQNCILLLMSLPLYLSFTGDSALEFFFSSLCTIIAHK